MFEKEAEKYQGKIIAEQDYPHSISLDWLRGADFGYNKCREEMQKNGLALQSDMDETIKQNIALKRMIEKMKCCGNCGKWENCEKDEMFSQDICGDWELER
jgi:hypothetical protein